MFSENIKKYILVVVSVLAAILIVWQNSPTNNTQQHTENSQDEPDFFIVNGKYTVFDETGKVSSIMQSDEAKHYPDRNSALLTHPDLLIYRKGNTPWRLTANSGEYDMSEERLQLTNNVTIVRDERIEIPWTLKTESLTLLNKSRFITTKQPVTISDSVSILEGTGMNAWVDEKKIELISNVRGKYAPQ